MARKGRRADRDIFKDALKDKTQGGKNHIGNASLRNELGWRRDRYERVRSILIDEGSVVVGKGKGGSLNLSKVKHSNGLKTFISYSHVDEKSKNELLKHLEPLVHSKLIEVWQDRKLKPGDEWEKSIASNLEKADAILLLVSIDFINSQYCYETELTCALERHSRGEAIVIPIILRDCLWQHAPFAKLQALPTGGKAISAWSSEDEAYTDIARELWKKMEERLSQ